MTRYKEDEIRIEAGQAWLELDMLITTVKMRQRNSIRELEDLNAKLPRMLAGVVKGVVTRGEVSAHKARMAELREVVQEAPIIIEELEREKTNRSLMPLQMACFLSKDRGRYEDLKEAFLRDGGSACAEELWRCAREIGEVEDCERFLEGACVGLESDKSDKRN